MHIDNYLIPFLAAPFVGSFLGVLIVRLPLERPVTCSRSICDHCARPLRWIDLVPIISYLMLRGRCRFCGAAIAPFHPIVELAAIAVPLSASLNAPDAAWLWADSVLGWGLLALAWIDARTMLLPDVLTLPLLLMGLAATAWLDPTSFTAHALAAALGYVGFSAIALSYRHLCGREGLGGGDAKLMAVAGAWLGITALPWVMLIAALLGLAWAAMLALRDRHITSTTALPFGPLLALAIWSIRNSW